MNIKRYVLESRNRGYEPYYEMFEEEEGDWVKYEDIKEYLIAPSVITSALADGTALEQGSFSLQTYLKALLLLGRAQERLKSTGECASLYEDIFNFFQNLT